MIGGGLGGKKRGKRSELGWKGGQRQRGSGCEREITG